MSPLALGCMAFGEPDEHSFMYKLGCPEPVAHGIMDQALDAGVNLWDVADVYGDDGLSERILGRWFKAQGPARRDQVVLATKGRFAMGEGPNDRGASRLYITRAVEASLRRLQTDRIDLYQIHMQDLVTEEDEVLRALDDLVSAGKIVYFGCSNYAAYRMVESRWISDRRGYRNHEILQAQYSLLHRELEREHIPFMERHGMGLLPWSPLAGGLLSGKYRRDQAAEGGLRWTVRPDRIAGISDKSWEIVEALREVAAELEATPAQVAIAWLLGRPTVTSVIFGCRSVEQLQDNVAAAELSLPDELTKKLDDISCPDFGYPYDFIGRVDGAW